ncbi:MAG: tyrosine-type recombinase/integrase [Marinilabiliaceae bacterium]|nr:tyrosine-type recombinase/integrase [Marinilabiliaceae bacterium]
MQNIQSFLKYIQFEKRSSNHTVVSYECDLKQFQNYIEVEGFISWPQITSKQIRQWMINLLDEGLTSKSVNRKIATLKSFFRFLMREGVVEVNPLDKIITPKIPKRLPEFVKEHEMDLLLDEIDFEKSYSGVRDHLIIELFYCTGLRLSELSGLTISSFDFSGDVIRVVGKRKKERIIPFSKKMRSSLIEYIEVRNSSFLNVANNILFLTDKGEPVYDKLIYRVVKKHLSLVTTMSKKSPHILRHTFATVLLNKGADINAIKELLGHSNLSATEIYTHNSFEQLNAIYNQAHPRA